MKTIVFSMLSLFLAAGIAKAQDSGSVQQFDQKVHISASYTSDSSQGVSKYSLRFVKNGKVELTINPNTCSGTAPNVACTTIELSTEVIEPTFVEDKRSADGALILQLTNSAQLAITRSKTSASEKLSIYERFSPGAKTTTYPLNFETRTLVYE
jgi:hypothetical protein